MPNKNVKVTKPVTVTGIVGTHLGLGTTCIPLTFIHLVDCNDGILDGRVSVITDGVDIMDYTEYSFLTLNTALDDLKYYEIQPQVSLDGMNYFDSDPAFVIKNFEIGSEIEKSLTPTNFGHYARLRITAESVCVPISCENESDRLANIYVFFHGRNH